MLVPTPLDTAVVVSPPAARTPTTPPPAARRRRHTSFDSTPDAATVSSAPSFTLPLSDVAVGTSSTMLTVMVPVAVLPLASVTR